VTKVRRRITQSYGMTKNQKVTFEEAESFLQGVTKFLKSYGVLIADILELESGLPEICTGLPEPVLFSRMWHSSWNGFYTRASLLSRHQSAKT